MARSTRHRVRFRRTAALTAHEPAADQLSTLAAFCAPVPSTGRDATSASALSYNRCEQRKALGERQWQPCQYCGFMIVQRRSCRCNQAWYCDSLCYRRDKTAHRPVCRWRQYEREDIYWQPCTYCGIGMAKKLKCPCRQVKYCDTLCQLRDWQAHKRQCHWHRHRCTARLLAAATLPRPLVAGLLRTADITERGPPSPWEWLGGDEKSS